MVQALIPPILAILSFPGCSGQAVNREVEIRADANHATELATVFEVPSGKMLVLEHVSLLVTLRFSSIVFGLVGVEGGEDKPATHRFQLESIGQSRDDYLYLNGQALRLYVPAGGRLSVGFFRYSAGSTGTAEATISGCLVDETSEEPAKSSKLGEPGV